MSKTRVEPCKGAVLPGGMVAGEVGPALKPCPFCGGVAEGKYDGADCDDPFRIMCKRCPAQMAWHGLEEDAIAAWNRRADDCVQLPEARWRASAIDETTRIPNRGRWVD